MLKIMTSPVDQDIAASNTVASKAMIVPNILPAVVWQQCLGLSCMKFAHSNDASLIRHLT